VRNGLADQWSRILRLRNRRFDESYGVGRSSDGWLAKYRHRTNYSPSRSIGAIAISMGSNTRKFDSGQTIWDKNTCGGGPRFFTLGRQRLDRKERHVRLRPIFLTAASVLTICTDGGATKSSTSQGPHGLYLNSSKKLRNCCRGRPRNMNSDRVRASARAKNHRYIFALAYKPRGVAMATLEWLLGERRATAGWCKATNYSA
jgi:hypothetical protein